MSSLNTNQSPWQPKPQHGKEYVKRRGDLGESAQAELGVRRQSLMVRDAPGQSSAVQWFSENKTPRFLHSATITSPLQQNSVQEPQVR